VRETRDWLRRRRDCVKSVRDERRMTPNARLRPRDSERSPKKKRERKEKN